MAFRFKFIVTQLIFYTDPQTDHTNGKQSSLEKRNPHRITPVGIVIYNLGILKPPSTMIT